MQTERTADREELRAVGRNQMRHRLTAQVIAMKPNAAVEGEQHPLAAALELTPGWCYWQTIRPSTVAGGIGGPAPANR